MKTVTTSAPKALKSFLLYPLSLLLLLGMFVFSGCNDCSKCVKVDSGSTDLWNGMFAQGIVVNKAVRNDDFGLVAVNITGKMEDDLHYVLYSGTHNGNFSHLDTVYIQAESKNGIPVVKTLLEKKPTSTLASNPTTSINEHNSHPHHYQQGRHFRGHIVIGSGGRVLIEESGNQEEIRSTSPFYVLAREIHVKKASRSVRGRVEVFVNRDNLSGEIMDIDTCHRHGEIIVECL